MADTYEQNLGQKSSLTSSDYIRVVGSDNVSYKQPLTALGSGMLPYIQYRASVDANDFQTSGVYYLASDCTNMPAAFMFLAVYRGNGSGDILQHAFSLAGEVYARRGKTSGTWSAWQKMPTRAEIDALNSKITTSKTVEGTTTGDGLISIGLHTWDANVTALTHRTGICVLYTDDNGNYYAKVLDYNMVKKASTSVSVIVRYIPLL